MTIRRARANEAATLTSLATRSKASHGYDEAFMRRVAPLLDLSDVRIEDRHLFVLDLEDASGALAGFYQLLRAADGDFLEDLWVEPALFGRGYGRRLFLHAAETATSLGWTAMSIESDPGAESFYEMMGAVRIGERRSGVGRMLPLMSMTLGISPA